ncbi:hypothetical protein K466DRAFT_298389 [Polyporus arcularius HHB13444]|uniref:Uncharacterized protein n=1 Tax=Polyporus arcularius HHB13444 TaxID=1314778 RepID=A0A5C3NZ55_9APHY|nr:hypothetical protein K466DRAFT_298389 [Polyporus arcularius HHB13444]
MCLSADRLRTSPVPVAAAWTLSCARQRPCDRPPAVLQTEFRGELRTAQRAIPAENGRYPDDGSGELSGRPPNIAVTLSSHCERSTKVRSSRDDDDARSGLEDIQYCSMADMSPQSRGEAGSRGSSSGPGRVVRFHERVAVGTPLYERHLRSDGRRHSFVKRALPGLSRGLCRCRRDYKNVNLGSGSTPDEQTAVVSGYLAARDAH